MADIQLQGLSKRFGPTLAVDDLSLSIEDGEFVVLLGPTGVGKTTILRLVAGLERPDAGRIAIAGVDVTQAAPAARDVAFVFQQYSLYPHLTVFDNLAFPLRSPLRPMDEVAIRTRVEQVAAMLRIGDKLASAATRLSGGQMQRVAIGRALVRSPSVYLMDEPLSSLDAKLRADLRLELKHIQRDLGATMIYVTHDQIEAMTMADRIGVIEHGRLVQLGTPRQIYRDPTSAYVATRLGTPAINLLPRSRFPDLAAPREAATLGVRPEHVVLRQDGGTAASGVPGRVTRVEPLGDQSHLHIDLDGTAIVTLVDPEVAMHEGDIVRVDLIDPLLFDADGRRVRMAQGASR